MRRRGHIAGMLIGALAAALCAQPGADPGTVLASAQKQYRAGDNDGAARTIQAWINARGKDTADLYLMPLLMEASVRKNDNSYARRLCKVYAMRFPASPFLPRLWYLDGIAAARERAYADALASFSRAEAGGVSSALDSLLVMNLRMLCERGLAREEVAVFSRSAELHPRVLEVIRYYDIAGAVQQGAAVEAGQNAEQFKRAYPRSPFLSAVNDLLARLRGEKKSVVRIGVLAPLSGYDAEVGRQMVAGLQAAVDHAAAPGRPEIKLVIDDTRGSIIETARKTLEFVDKFGIKFLIGPALSHDAAATACLLRDRDVIVVSPTATEDGITELDRNFFQVNVTPRALGASIARYAAENLTIKEFALLAPLSDYGAAITLGFRDQVRASGGTIVAEEYYEEGTRDFRTQFESVRKKLARFRYEKMAGAAGTAGLGRTHKADSLFLADSVMDIGGFFAPAESDEAVMIAAQVYFHKIRTQLLGSAGWHQQKTITDGKRYVTNAIFSTNLLVAAGTPEYEQFVKAYRERAKSEPDRVAALGYDAAQLLIGALAKNDDPGAVREALSSVKSFSGASGRITIDPELHFNTDAAIMRISENQFIRLR
jgi:ABC-type branched-subunit amino acid transport system substrate-binding protein